MSISIERWDDASSWNAFTAAAAEPHFQQSWEWGEISPLLGGRPVRLAAVENGTIRGAMQVFINPVNRTSTTQLYVPRGPVIAGPEVPVLGALLDGARSLGLQERALGLRIEPNVVQTDENWPRTLTSFGLHATYPPSQPRSAWVLDLQPDPDTLLAAMKQKTRYNIRLASRKGVVVSEAPAADLDEFYPLYVETARRDGFFIHDIELYREMFGHFRASGMFCMLFARFEGRLIAATTLVRFGNTCWYLHGASSNEHRNLMAPYLLQWEGITRARTWGCTVYDFRAIPDVLTEDQDMYGVYRFKEGFGGRKVTMLHTFAAPYRHGLFGLWQMYFTGRFRLEAARRKRAGLPARQFA